LETVVNLIDFDMDLYTAIVTPKFCSSTHYSQLRLEDGFPEETVLDWYFGGVAAVHLLDGYMIGVGAPRDDGSAVGVK
jgi:gamma-glutamyltranspeptidase